MKHTVDAPRALAVIAAAGTVISTAVAFWLSYEHLVEVARRYGLGGSPERAVAWPATVDLFILIGEALIFRSLLLRRGIDWWAVAFAGSGYVASITLNVAGVGAAGDPREYVVAAVPPVSAGLAFGMLMRQLHEVLAARTEGDETAKSDPPTPPVSLAKTVANSAAKSAPVGDVLAAEPGASSEPPQPGNGTTGPAPGNAPAPESPAPSKPRSRRSRKTARTASSAPRRSMTEWVTLTEPIFHEQFRALRRQPTAAEFAEAIERAGHGRPSPSTAKNIRTEILDRTDVPALD